MLNRLTHQALQLACRRSDNAFRKESKLLEFVQRQKLAKILQQVAAANGRIKTAVPTWEEFAVNQPVTRYGQWQEALTHNVGVFINDQSFSALSTHQWFIRKT